MNQLYSIHDCALRLAVPEHKIAYAHRMGRLEDASYLIAGKRIYTEADLLRIADYFRVPLPRREEHAK